MATNEYRLSYTANEINNKLGQVGYAIRYDAQSLTEAQKEQARKNIGIDELSSGASSTIDLEPVEDENGTGVQITVHTVNGTDGGATTERYIVYNGKDGTGGSGESNMLIVTVDESGTASMSLSEIKMAVAEGKCLFFIFNGMVIPYRSVATNGGVECALFSQTFVVSGTEESYTMTAMVYVAEDKTTTSSNVKTISIPTPTESDYGKVLSATADGLVWVTPSGGSAVPSAMEVAF